MQICLNLMLLSMQTNALNRSNCNNFLLLFKCCIFFGLGSLELARQKFEDGEYSTAIEIAESLLPSENNPRITSQVRRGGRTPASYVKQFDDIDV